MLVYDFISWMPYGSEGIFLLLVYIKKKYRQISTVEEIKIILSSKDGMSWKRQPVWWEGQWVVGVMLHPGQQEEWSKVQAILRMQDKHYLESLRECSPQVFCMEGKHGEDQWVLSRIWFSKSVCFTEFGKSGVMNIWIGVKW